MKFAVRAVVGLVLVGMTAPIVPASANPLPGDENPVPVSQSVQTRKNARATNHPDKTRGFATSFQAASIGTPHWISVARQYMGTNPTKRRTLWCAEFLNFVLERSGMKGTSSAMAKSFTNYGTRISGPKVGAIAVVSRGKTAGHVGIVTGIDSNGNPILLSGNHNNTVAEAPYSANRVIAYVWPTS